MTKQPPEMLYKYRSMTGRSIEMLANNEVYFANPREFNDPFDCSAQEYMHANFREDMAKVEASLRLQIAPEFLANDQIQLLREEIDRDPEMIESARSIQADMDVLRERLGVLSLSARNDSILMWSHYADMHRGFCIGFLSNNFGVPTEEFREVFYSGTRNLNFAFNLISDTEMTEEMFVEEFLREYILTKYIDWQYEQEWRWIGQARTTSKYPDTCIDRIIFGLNMRQENREKIMSVLQDKNVKYFEAIKSTTDFAIDIQPIN